MIKPKTIYYQKPDYICQISEKSQYSSDKEKFIKDYKKDIADHFKNSELYLRLGTSKDVKYLDDFVRESYQIFGNKVVNDVSPYDIYRFAKFGNAIVLEDNKNDIAGCIFEIGYDTPDRSSYTIRLAINPKIKGKNLGFSLLEYSCLLAMERGSLVKRGLMETDNIASCNILVNKMGWICDGFETDLHCGINNGFTISLPLTPEGFTTNRIDNTKLLNFIKHNKAGKRFLLIDANDIDKLRKTYEKNDFWVVAVIRKGQIADSDQFFALAVEELNIY